MRFEDEPPPPPEPPRACSTMIARENECQDSYLIIDGIVSKSLSVGQVFHGHNVIELMQASARQRNLNNTIHARSGGSLMDSKFRHNSNNNKEISDLVSSSTYVLRMRVHERTRVLEYDSTMYSDTRAVLCSKKYHVTIYLIMVVETLFKTYPGSSDRVVERVIDCLSRLAHDCRHRDVHAPRSFWGDVHVQRSTTTDGYLCMGGWDKQPRLHRKREPPPPRALGLHGPRRLRWAKQREWHTSSEEPLQVCHGNRIRTHKPQN